MKTALITGGSAGIGQATALELARRDVGVIATYRSHRAEGEETVARIRAEGGRAVALPLDLDDTSSLDRFAASVVDALGATWGTSRLDFLVNNAGAGGGAMFAEITEDLFDFYHRVLFKGPYFLTQKLLRLMADGGSIINVSTGLARFTLPGYGAYASMKGGVEVLTRYLAKELGPRGITVNTLAPGAIETDFGGGAVRDNP